MIFFRTLYKSIIHHALYNWRLSTVRNLQYVTIDRGNRFRGSNRGTNEGRDSLSNNVESVRSRLEDQLEVATDAPQAVTSTGRNLE